jgi:hypothetical protein
MRKILIGIVVALAFTISAFGATAISANADESNTPWVNDESYPSGGFYLDVYACQAWSPDRGWHQHAPSAPLWVNYPYGTWESGGGFYWDPVSCQVWTADSGWHVFNTAGIWPPQPTRPPVDNCAKTLAKGEIAFVRAGCFVMGDVRVGPTSTGPWEDLVYDDNPKTGTIVIVANNLWVQAYHGGASVQSIEFYWDSYHAMRAHGCEKSLGCDWINTTSR